MSDVKSFRFDYLPKEAHTDFMTLSAEEIGVLMQICNLIYLNHAPIENDPKWISQSIRDMGPAKCRNIIKSLLEKEHIWIVPHGEFEGYICKTRCLKSLKNVEKLRRNSKNLSIISELLNMVIQPDQQHRGALEKETETDIEIPPNPQGGIGGISPNNSPKTQRKKRHGKTNLAEQANALLEKYSDPEPDQNDDCIF